MSGAEYHGGVAVERIPVTDYMHTHPNCRCVMVPVAKSWTELGYPEVDAAIASGELEGPAKGQSGETVLEGMTKRQQQRILGLGRWNAWAGAKGRPGIPNETGLSLSQMVGDVYNPDWGWMLRLENFDDVLVRYASVYGDAEAQKVRELRYPPKPVTTPVTKFTVSPAYTGPLNQDTVDALLDQWDIRTGDHRVTEQVNAHLTKLVEGTEVRIRVPESHLGLILADGRVKSQFETQTSQGTLSPEVRARSEDILFYPDAAPENEDRPIYGYVSTPNGDEMSAMPYGDIVIRLKDDVRARTTITFGDSLYAARDDEVAATPLVAPNVASVYFATDPQDVLDWRGPVEDIDDVFYVEAQVHGQVRLDDIAEVVFTSDPLAKQQLIDQMKTIWPPDHPREWGDPVAEHIRLTQMLREKGVPYREAYEWDYDRARRDALTPVSKLRPVAAPGPAVARETRLPAKPKAKAKPTEMLGPVASRTPVERALAEEGPPLLDYERGTTPEQRGQAVGKAATQVEQAIDDVIEAVNRTRVGLRLSIAQSAAVAAYRQVLTDLTSISPPADYVPAPLGLHFDRPKDPTRAAVFDTALVARKAIADALGVAPVTSKWSGDVNIESDSYPRTGSFSWDGTLNIRQATADSIPRRVATTVHEVLHSLSTQTPAAYNDWPGWEEGVAQAMTYLLIPQVAETMGYDAAAILETIGDEGYTEYTAPLEAIRQTLAMEPMDFYSTLLKTPLSQRPDKVAQWAAEADLSPVDWRGLFQNVRRLDLVNPTRLAATHEERRHERWQEAADVTDFVERVRDVLDIDARTFYRPLLELDRAHLALDMRDRVDEAMEKLLTDGTAESRELSNELSRRWQGVVFQRPGDERGVLIGEGRPTRLEGRAPSLSQVVEATYAKAAKAEPAISAIVKAVAYDVGARVNYRNMLDFRLKSITSLRRKIADDARIKHITAQQAADGLFDTVRYTYILPLETYTEQYEETLAAFERLGFTFERTKNFWGHPPPVYQGVNSVLIAPDGTHFELQFHTQDSWRAKEANHLLKDPLDAILNAAIARAELTPEMTESERYMAIRAVLTDEQRHQVDSMIDTMRDTEAAVTIPPGALGIKAFDRREAPPLMLGPEVTPEVEVRAAARTAGVAQTRHDTFLQILADHRIPEARPVVEGVHAGGFLIVRGVAYDTLYDANSAVAVWDKGQGYIDYDAEAVVAHFPFNDIFAGTPTGRMSYQYIEAPGVEWGPEPTVVTDPPSFNNVRDLYINRAWWTNLANRAMPVLSNYPANHAAYGHYGEDGALDGILVVMLDANSTYAVSAVAYLMAASRNTEVLAALRQAARDEGLRDSPPTPAQEEATVEAEVDHGPPPASVFTNPESWMAHLERLTPANREQREHGVFRLFAPAYYVDASTTHQQFDGTNGLLAYGRYDTQGDLQATYFVDMVDGRPMGSVIWLNPSAYPTDTQQARVETLFREQWANDWGARTGFLQPIPRGIEPETILNTEADWSVVEGMIERRESRLTGMAPSAVRQIARPVSDVLHIFTQTNDRGDVIAVLTVRTNPDGTPITMNPGVVTFRPAYTARDVLDVSTVQYIADNLRRYAISRDVMDPDVLPGAVLQTTGSPTVPTAGEPVQTIINDANMVIVPDSTVGNWNISRDDASDFIAAMNARGIPLAGTPGTVVKSVSPNNSTIYALYTSTVGDVLGGALSQRYAEVFGDGSATVHTEPGATTESAMYSMRFFEGVIAVDRGRPVAAPTISTIPTPEPITLDRDPTKASPATPLHRGSWSNITAVLTDLPSDVHVNEVPVTTLREFVENGDVRIPMHVEGQTGYEVYQPSARQTQEAGATFIIVDRYQGDIVMAAGARNDGRINIYFEQGAFGDRPRDLRARQVATMVENMRSQVPAPAPAPQVYPTGTLQTGGWVNVYSFVRQDIEARGIAFTPGVYDVHTQPNPTATDPVDRPSYTWRAWVTTDGVAALMAPSTGDIYVNPDNPNVQNGGWMTFDYDTYRDFLEGTAPEQGLPDFDPDETIIRPTEEGWTTDEIIESARNSLTTPSLMGSPDGVYWGHDRDGDWGAFSVVNGEVVGYALFSHEARHIGTYVNPFNTSNPTDAEVVSSFEGPVREIAGAPTPTPAPAPPAPPGRTLLRLSEAEFNVQMRAFTEAPQPVVFPQPNTVYDVTSATGEHLRGYYNSDAGLVLVAFENGNVIAHPDVTNTYDAEVLAIFDRTTAPPTATTRPTVETLPLETYRERILAPIANQLPVYEDRPSNVWRHYVDPNTGEVYRVYFDASRYAAAVMLPSGTYATYEAMSPSRLATIFAMPEDTSPPRSRARPPDFLVQPVPVFGGGFGAMPTDYDFNSTTVRQIAQGVVNDGLEQSVDAVLNGPPLTAAFFAYGYDEGGFLFYGPEGGAVSSAWVRVGPGGDVTDNNPDGLRVLAVNYVKTHELFRRHGYATRMYEWATLNGFRIEEESGRHGLTDIGSRYYHERVAKPFSRISMGLSRMRPELGSPQTYDDVLGLRKTKAIRDAQATMPDELREAGVDLVPTDAPLSYYIGTRAETRIIPHTEATIGYYAGTPEPSQTIELDPSRADIDDIDFAAAYAVRKNKQDSVVVTLVGDVAERLYGKDYENGSSVRIEGIDPDNMRAVYQDIETSVTRGVIPGATIHDTGGLVEVSLFKGDLTDEAREALTHIADAWGGRLRIIPAHITFYWHDQQTEQEARDGWFQGPADASITADAVKRRLRVAGDTARADRIVRRRRTVAVRPSPEGGPGAARTGEGATEGVAAHPGPAPGGPVAAFPRTGPRGHALVQPTSAAARRVHEQANRVLDAIEQATGLTNVRWTGAVEVIPHFDYSGQLAWDGTLRVADDVVDQPGWDYILTHEMYHAVTDVTAEEFGRDRWLEEGVTEEMTRRLLSAAGVAIMDRAQSPYIEMLNALERVRQLVNIPAPTFYANLSETPLRERAWLITDWVETRATSPHAMRDWARERYDMTRRYSLTGAQLHAEYTRWERLRADLGQTEREFYAEMGRAKDVDAWLTGKATEVILSTPAFPRPRWASGKVRRRTNRLAESGGGEPPEPVLALALADYWDDNEPEETTDAVRNQVPKPAPARPRVRVASTNARRVQRGRRPAPRMARRRS